MLSCLLLFVLHLYSVSCYLLVFVLFRYMCYDAVDLFADYLYICMYISMFVFASCYCSV